MYTDGEKKGPQENKKTTKVCASCSAPCRNQDCALKRDDAREEEDEPHTRCRDQHHFVDCNADCSLDHGAARREGDGHHTCRRNRNLFLDHDTL